MPSSAKAGPTASAVALAKTDQNMVVKTFIMAAALQLVRFCRKATRQSDGIQAAPPVARLEAG
jgi:hypothetical protein